MLLIDFDGLSIILRTTITDVDVDSVVEYRMSNDSSLFAVDPSSGVVTALASLDRERSSRHQFAVYAVDGGTPAALTATARVVVNVLDANDRAPVFTDAASYNFRVAERLPIGAEVGAVRARDADAPPNNRFRYELLDGDGGRGRRLFALDAETGLLTTRRRLDREERAAYRMLATARDDADRSLVSTARASGNVCPPRENRYLIEIVQTGYRIPVTRLRWNSFSTIQNQLNVRRKQSGRGARQHGHDHGRRRRRQ